MTTLHIDFETRSTADLKDVGLDNYARDPSTDVWCMAWAFDDGLVNIAGGRGLKVEPDLRGNDHIPQMLRYVRDGGLVIGHNVGFELAIWNNIMVPRYGWPELKVEQCRCTMAMAYAMALPGSLENAGAAVGIANAKDVKGGRLMLQMARPRRIEADGTPVWWDDEDRKQRLYNYCKQDVEAERELHSRLMELSDQERAVWLLDYQINQRGVYVDLQAINAAIKVVEAEQKRLNDKMRKVTDGAVGACSEAAALTRWLGGLGVDTSGVAKADVVDLLGRAGLPPQAHAALKLRQEGAKSSTAKLYAMIDAVSEDGRLRGMFQYHGAGTGRWAGRKVQLQNLPRPSLKHDVIDDLIDGLADGLTAEDIDSLYGPPMTAMSDCLRGFLTAAPGKELIAADFSNIESRVLAWLAGAEWKLQAFRDYDAGKGPDIYLVAIAPLYGMTATDPATKPFRQQGKVVELAGGFGGGVGAVKMMAKTYFVDLNKMFESAWPYAAERHRAKALELLDKEKTAPDSRNEYLCGQLVKLSYREQNPEIVQHWYDLENAALNAVRYPGDVFTAGPARSQVKYRKRGSFLWCLLPSGRMLCYPYARIVEGKFGNDALQYKSVNGITRKWEETDTFGGKLAENNTQAVARDLLAAGLLRLDQRGYETVMHIHDEAVVEVPLGFGSVEEVENISSETPAWAAGMPVTAEGWRGLRYRK